MRSARHFDDLSDAELLARLHDAVTHERHGTAQLIALLTAVDVRKLYLAQGCSSLYTYCTQVLHLSEHAAYARIEAARAARDFPLVLEGLENGSLTLTAVCLLKPILTAANHVGILDAAAHKSRLDLERLVATLRPQADAAAVIRKLTASYSGTPAEGGVETEATATGNATEATAMNGAAQPTGMGPVGAPVDDRAMIKPIAPERYRIQLTISGEAHDNLRRVQNLVRYRSPYGDLSAIFERAIALLLDRTLRTKAAITDRARSMAVTTTHTRPIPAAVRRAVWERDSGRCAFKGALMRCTETRNLEYHHVIPFAVGGETSVGNLELRCRAHNSYEAREFFGQHDDTRLM